MVIRGRVHAGRQMPPSVAHSPAHTRALRFHDRKERPAGDILLLERATEEEPYRVQVSKAAREAPDADHTAFGAGAIRAGNPHQTADLVIRDLRLGGKIPGHDQAATFEIKGVFYDEHDSILGSEGKESNAQASPAAHTTPKWPSLAMGVPLIRGRVHAVVGRLDVAGYINDVIVFDF